MNARILAALVTVQVLFGGLPIAGKLVFVQMHPFAFMAVRAAGAAIVLLLILAVLKRPFPIHKHWRAVILLSSLGVVLNQGIFVMGLARTTAVNVAVIITSIPVFTYLIALLMRRETFGPRRAIGILLALSGIGYLIGLSRYDTGHMVGDLLVVTNCLAYSAYLVVGKRTMEQVDTLGLVAWMFVFASIIFVPIGLYYDVTTSVAQLATNNALWLLFAILGPSAAVYVLNATALKNVPSSTVAVFIYLQPIVTAIGAAIILHEALTVKLLPAAIAVALGVWIVAVRRPKATTTGLRHGSQVLE